MAKKEQLEEEVTPQIAVPQAISLGRGGPIPQAKVPTVSNLAPGADIPAPTQGTPYFTNIAGVAAQNGLQPYSSAGIPASAGIFSNTTADQLKVAQPGTLPASVGAGSVPAAAQAAPMATDQNGKTIELSPGEDATFRMMEQAAAQQAQAPSTVPAAMGLNFGDDSRYEGESLSDVLGDYRPKGIGSLVMAGKLVSKSQADANNRFKRDEKMADTALDASRVSETVRSNQADEQNAAARLGIDREQFGLDREKFGLDKEKAAAEQDQKVVDQALKLKQGGDKLESAEGKAVLSLYGDLLKQTDPLGKPLYTSDQALAIAQAGVAKVAGTAAPAALEPPAQETYSTTNAKGEVVKGVSVAPPPQPSPAPAAAQGIAPAQPAPAQANSGPADKGAAVKLGWKYSGKDAKGREIWDTAEGKRVAVTW
jgi:hypothetical protein